MNAASFIRLLLLAAIWGGSFLFFRIAAPVFEPAQLIVVRVGLAAAFLYAVALARGYGFEWRGNGRHFLILGFFNSALPFTLYAYAAKTTSASLLSVLNATAPLWAAVFSIALTRSMPSLKTLVGLALGIMGVATLAGIEALHLPAGGGPAILAGIAAAASYGIASNYARSTQSVAPFANALGSMAAATVVLAPLAAIAPLPTAMPSLIVVLSVIGLGVLCSGVAYPMYFRLIADVGVAPALTVSYLIPVFGILLGVVFLDETVGWHTLIGSVAVLTGTALVTGFSPRLLFGSKRRR